ncbi:WD repeat containing protein 36 [Fasciola hepatica]|uniref:WD repeat containing protein 36 n=1 Tax=Fasciola hepatica TaxID=6192 RepID=A0A4E0R0U9_FASHE|nr:WD repeat containing protein 36 [Fasciola hepatica]
MSNIFQPYRVVGLCSSDVPFIVRYAAHSNDYYAFVPVGENFNVYKLPRLTLVAISDNLNAPIKAFTSSAKYVYAASGNTIYAFRNMRFLACELHKHCHSITYLLAFGQSFLASVDESGLLVVWALETHDVVFEMQFDSKVFRISCLLGPLSYRNKILLGSHQGALQLWNVQSQKQIYWFKGFGAAVTCLTQAPAVDLCAIGLADGSVYLHNLRYDITLLRFVHDGGAVTSITFKTDSEGLNNPCNVRPENELSILPSQQTNLYIAVGNAAGQLSCWQLKEDGESRPVGSTKHLHWDRIVSMFCIPGGESAGSLVTAGADNCIKVSCFDRPDGGLRTVFKRAGHFRPPNRICFWPGSSVGGSLILSAGQDSVMRIFSTFNQYMDKSLGRAYAPGAPDSRKATVDQRSAWLLPGCSKVSLCATRAADWDSVVAIHADRRQATTWNFVNATRGKHWLDPKKFVGKGGAAVRLYKHTVATAVCITNCGNYVLIGYSTGDVVLFNLQSGLEQGYYDKPSVHPGAVVGIAVNNVMHVAVTVGGQEIRFWSFRKREMLHSEELPTVATQSLFHSDNDTLAVALSTGPIHLYDVTHRQLIRRFPNPDTQPCVDMAFSSDGFWLISAHRGDPLIKTWDIIHGRLIDCFRVSAPITSIALSPAGEFLATTHANCLGVYLWDNCGTYKRLHLQLLSDDYVPAVHKKPVAMPSRSIVTLFKDSSVENQSDTEDIEMHSVDQTSPKEVAESRYNSPDQLADTLITLSGLPVSHLTGLLNLDTILERNRRAIAVRADKQQALPFFLPVVETDKGLAWVDDEKDGGPKGEQSKQPNSTQSRVVTQKRRLEEDSLTALEPIPGLGVRLVRARSDLDFDDIMRTLKSLGPSALDLEIRLLGPSAEDELIAECALNASESTVLRTSRDRLHGFLRLLINRFQRNLDVDLACVCFELVLQRYGDLLFARSGVSSSGTTESLESHIRNLLSDEAKSGSDNETLRLVAQAVKVKSASQMLLARRVNRSICLVDFIRNPTTVLHS